MFSEGQVLDGTYRLRRLIGAGGNGAVYEATHARWAGRYAIKVLLQNLSENPDVRAWFDREARITSLLRHPNVVQVIGHDTAADGTAYLVMEYLRGESLAQRSARCGPLPVVTVVDIVDQIAAGLAAAHAHGIVHRDLKPENVFLIPVARRGAADQVKILDFGISKVASSCQAIDRALCGTPQYMSPEQVDGRVAEIDRATDQFALAVVAYELLVGRNPFMADDVGAIFDRVARVVPAPAGVSGTVDAVLARGMAKAKGDRFSSISEFAAALRTAARVRTRGQGAPRAPRSQPDSAPGTRRSYRHHGPALALMAGAAIVALISLGRVDPLHSSEPRPEGSGVAAAAVPAEVAPAVAPPAASRREATAPEVARSAAESTAVSPPASRDRPARAARRPSTSPLEPPTPTTLSPDEDATMPLSGTPER